MAQSRPTSMPAFRPLKSRTTVLMLGASEWGKIVAIALLGALLAFSTGSIVHEVEVPINATQHAQQLASLETLRTTMRSLEQRMAAAGATSIAQVDMTSSERQDASTAERYGITSASSDEDLESLVPSTVVETQPIIPTLQRWFIMFALPCIVVAGMNIEYAHGTTPVKELKRVWKNGRAEHICVSSPRQYLERFER